MDDELNERRPLFKAADSTKRNNSKGNGCTSRWDSASHPKLAVIVAFLAFMIDAILVTTVDPILPDILNQIDAHPNRLFSRDMFTKAVPFVPSNSTEGLARENSVGIAVLVRMKPGLEVFFNIACGFLIDRIGHRTPMIVGCMFNLGATLSFGYMRNFYLLMIARALQALGGSLSVVNALAFLAVSFPCDKARLRATSIAFSGFTVGIAGGYSMGSFLYEFCSTECPFLVIAVLSAADVGMRLCLVAPSSKKTVDNKSGLRYAKQLLSDPDILMALGMNFIQKFCIGVWVGTGPAWLLFTLHSPQWNIGAIFAILSVVQIVTQIITGKVTEIQTIWRFMFGAFLLVTIGMAMVPFCTSTWLVVMPDVVSRLGHGVLIACLNPVLNYIGDLRHNSRYGLINGLYTSSYNLGLFAGPNAAGALLKVIPFQWVYWGTATLAFAASLFTLRLRKATMKLLNNPEEDCHNEYRDIRGDMADHDDIAGEPAKSCNNNINHLIAKRLNRFDLFGCCQTAQSDRENLIH